MLPLPSEDDCEEEGRAQQRCDRSDRQCRAVAQAARQRIRQQEQDASAQGRGGDRNTVVLPQQAFCHMRTDDAHKSDNAQKRDAHRRDDRGKKHGGETQKVHMHAHAFGGGIPAQQRVELPAHQREKTDSKQHDRGHDRVRSVCRAAKITEGPDHGGGKPDIRGVELQNSGRRRPDRTDGDACQHNNAGLKSSQAAKTEDQENGRRGKEKGHQGRGVRIRPYGVV